MRNEQKALFAIASMSSLFDVLEERPVDLSDFADTVEMIGLDAKELADLHPFQMIHKLAAFLAQFDMNEEFLKGMFIEEGTNE